MITDRNLNRKRITRFIYYNQFSFEPSHTHTLATGGVTTTITTDSGEALSGMDDGAPLISEVSTFGVGGIEIAAAGDSFSCWDLETLLLADLSEEIGVRVRYTADATPAANDSVTWLATYKQADLGEAWAAPSTALDTVIGAHANGGTTARVHHVSGRGIINANSFDATAKNGGLIWNVEADVLSGYSANEVKFIALQIDYVPHTYQKAGENKNTHSSYSAT